MFGHLIHFRRGAFTLIEVIVVVLVLAIAAAMIVPKAMDTSDIQGLQAARLVSAHLEYARDLAISSATPVTVTYDVTGRSYTLTNISGALIDPITKASPYTINFATMPGFSKVTFVSASFSGAGSVTFDETGAPNNAGTVSIAAGTHSYQIAVAAAIGKVTVSGS